MTTIRQLKYWQPELLLALLTGYTSNAKYRVKKSESDQRVVFELELVAQTHRRSGIGRLLVDALANKSTQAGLRILVNEIQTTNVPAIRFYRRLGFELEGVDLSYYSNDDIPDGEVAVFMKKRLP